MNRIAFVFIHSPHGTSAGREGLDALLATAAFSEEIGIFFIADGVLLLLPKQQPLNILARDFISTLGVLPLYYNIKKVSLCAQSVEERGIISNDVSWVLPIELLSSSELNNRIATYNVILTF